MPPGLPSEITSLFAIESDPNDNNIIYLKTKPGTKIDYDVLESLNSNSSFNISEIAGDLRIAIKAQLSNANTYNQNENYNFTLHLKVKDNTEILLHNLNDGTTSYVDPTTTALTDLVFTEDIAPTVQAFLRLQHPTGSYPDWDYIPNSNPDEDGAIAEHVKIKELFDELFNKSYSLIDGENGLNISTTANPVDRNELILLPEFDTSGC